MVIQHTMHLHIAHVHHMPALIPPTPPKPALYCPLPPTRALSDMRPQDERPLYVCNTPPPILLLLPARCV
jgi:hypothetical protein